MSGNLSCVCTFAFLGPLACPETSVRNHHSMLYNTSEEWRSHMMI